VLPLGRINGTPAAAAPKWQLYDLRSDSSQTVDVGDRFPAKLAAMRQDFDEEARRNHVFPILSNGLMELLPQNRPEVTAREGHFTFFPARIRYSEGTFPSIHNRSWSIDADLDVPPQGTDGVVVTQGGRFLGWGLVMLKGIPTFLYRTSDTAGSLTRLAAPSPLTPGPHHVTVRFTVDGPGLGRGGALAMAVDGRSVAAGRLDRTVPVKFASEGATIGYDTGTPLSDDYRIPFPVQGLRSVTFDLGPAQVAPRLEP
jgi:arylsulfatase